MGIAVNPKAEEADGFVVYAAIIASLAMLSYSQTHLLISMIIALIYFVWRSYFWYTNRNRYIRFSMYMVITYIFIYFFARRFQ